MRSGGQGAEIALSRRRGARGPRRVKGEGGGQGGSRKRQGGRRREEEREEVARS